MPIDDEIKGTTARKVVHDNDTINYMSVTR